MQFTTDADVDLAKRGFKKSAASVSKYQVVTTERKITVRNFSPFPRIPDINLIQAEYLVESFKRAPNQFVS